MIIEREIRHFHMACGLGGGAKGFNKASARVGNMVGKFRCIGGVDVDAAACRDFERMTGVKATKLDLMDRAQYVAFHKTQPPADWREAVPGDIHRACRGERPHIVFASYPCKGFSGLLSEKASGTDKYQALNGLTMRGMMLVCEAFKDDPVELIVFENVPRIATRGRWLLDQICALLRSYGYAVAETTHDCGELGGLAQSRKRFLLVARHMAKVPNFLYEPVKQRLRGVGEVLDKLPLPLSGLGGPMHRMPALQWKTWVRLAFVEAGSDWRSLDKLTIEDGVLKDFGIMPDYGYRGMLGVTPWGSPSCTVSSRGLPTNGGFAVADPRFDGQPRRATFGVRGWSEASGVTGGESFPTNGAYAVSDPRVDGHPKSVQLGVRPWDKPAAVITGKMFAGGGPNSVADPRLQGKRFNNVFRIVPYDAPAPAVAGPGGPGGGLAVADPRPSKGADGSHGKYHVTPYDGPARAVISGRDNGAFVVADPRAADGRHRNGKYRVTSFDEPANAVTAASTTGNGAFVVAGPRLAVAGGNDFHGLRVNTWEQPAGAVTTQRSPGSSAQSVADPRPEFARNGRDHYTTAGHYGVLRYDEPAKAISGHPKNNNGFNSVVDPRVATGYGHDDHTLMLPAPSERIVCVIQALDQTWHRPFTTLELAAIQSLVEPEDFLELDGLSDSAWRERIGNAVPPQAAEAMGGVLGRCLLGAWSGETFSLSSEPIWVQPIAIALMAGQ